MILKTEFLPGLFLFTSRIIEREEYSYGNC
nr:MAG TPA: hypothetical protein [Caudoviricetes sp.]